jgi:hypothetical protein
VKIKTLYPYCEQVGRRGKDYKTIIIIIIIIIIIGVFLYLLGGRDIVGGIATRYRLDGPGFEIRWQRDFPDRPPGPPSILSNGYRVSLQRVQQPGRRVDYPSASRAQVECG